MTLRLSFGVSSIVRFWLFATAFVMILVPELVLAQTNQRLAIVDGRYKGTSDRGSMIELKIEQDGTDILIALSFDGDEIERILTLDPNGSGYIGHKQTLFSVLGGKLSPDPLRGDEMFWARTRDDALIIYSMKIDDRGHFFLRQLEFIVVEEGLRLLIDDRRHSREKIDDQAVLSMR